MYITDLFTDIKIISSIQERLPELFHLAELESSRAGKIGMEVGTLRERYLSPCSYINFGEHNVETNIPVTEPEMDVKVFGKPISIKTMTGKRLGSIKLIWTVDAEKAFKFGREYLPSCDTILTQVN
jgi:hypothetical protein